jgi:hypothetical protein
MELDDNFVRLEVSAMNSNAFYHFQPYLQFFSEGRLLEICLF